MKLIPAIFVLLALRAWADCPIRVYSKLIDLPPAVASGGRLSHGIDARVEILVKNISHERQIVLKGTPWTFYAYLKDTDKVAVLICKFAMERGAAGLPVMPEYEIASVALDFGETVELKLPVRIGAGVDMGTLKLLYKVDPLLAKRFGAWSGSMMISVMSESTDIAAMAAKDGG